MLKRILITLIFLINIGVVYAQQYTARDLIGRWQESREKKINIYFLTDSTAAWLTNEGLLHNKMNYTAKADKGIIEIRGTTEVYSKSPRYYHPYIKFINDSTFLMRSGLAKPKDADTANKKVAMFVKVKNELPGTQMRLPSFKDLLGQWVLMFKNEPRSSKLNFIDSNRVIKKTSGSVALMDYVIDFTKQPITIDFYIKGEPYKQAFLIFESRDDVRIEFFDPGKRKDHFTAFGQNYGYRKEAALGLSNN